MLCGNPAPLILAGFDSFRDVSMMRVIPDMTVVIPGDDRSVRRRHRSRRKNQNRRQAASFTRQYSWRKPPSAFVFTTR